MEWGPGLPRSLWSLELGPQKNRTGCPPKVGRGNREERTSLNCQEDTQILITLDKPGRGQVGLGRWSFSTSLPRAGWGPAAVTQPHSQRSLGQEEAPETTPGPPLPLRLHKHQWAEAALLGRGSGRLGSGERKAVPFPWERGRDRSRDVPRLASASPSASLGIVAQRRVSPPDMEHCLLWFPRPAEGSKA